MAALPTFHGFGGGSGALSCRLLLCRNWTFAKPLPITTESCPTAVQAESKQGVSRLCLDRQVLRLTVHEPLHQALHGPCPTALLGSPPRPLPRFFQSWVP